jgi:chondroitin synthase
MPLLPTAGFANDTSFISDLLPAHPRAPEEVVGVVIPHYCRERELELCLEALALQTYGARRIEVVVADDGTPSALAFIQRRFGACFFALTVVRQADLGFRLSAVRNLGIDAIRHARMVVVLDCDIIPRPELVAAHVEVLRVSENVISVGLRQDDAHVATLDDVLRANPAYEHLDWRARTVADGAPRHPRPWLLCSGGNLAFHKRLHELDRFDEGFTFWGGEDNEWAYRLYLRGVYFHFNTRATGLHANLTHISYDKVAQRAQGKSRLARRCPSFIPHAPSDVPLVSVWVTNYAKNAYIESAISALDGCAFGHEVVIVDNHPSERTPQHVATRPHVRVVQEPQVGAHYAFERALRECRGEFLVQLDGDDTLDIGFVNDVVRALLEQPYGLVYGLNDVMNADGSPSGIPVWVPSQRTRFENILCGMHIRSPRVIRRRDLSRAPRRPFTRAAVDFNLYSKLLMVTEPLCVERVAYHYRRTPGAISDVLADDQLRDTFSVIEHNRALLVGGHALVEASRGRRSVQYAQPTPPLTYFAHLGLTPEYAAQFSAQVLRSTGG